MVARSSQEPAELQGEAMKSVHGEARRDRAMASAEQHSPVWPGGTRLDKTGAPGPRVWVETPNQAGQDQEHPEPEQGPGKVEAAPPAQCKEGC